MHEFIVVDFLIDLSSKNNSIRDSIWTRDIEQFSIKMRKSEQFLEEYARIVYWKNEYKQNKSESL